MILVDALATANAALPPGWTIELVVERRFRYRNRYTVVARRDGVGRARWPGVYDVERLLPVVVRWIEERA